MPFSILKTRNAWKSGHIARGGRRKSVIGVIIGQV
jgi:hypothetical protein